MKPLAKRLTWVFAVVLVLLVILVAALPLVISSDAVRKRIEAVSADFLDARLEIQDLDVSWFGGLEIRGLVIGNPPGFSPGPFVSCAEATGGIALWPLFRGVIDLQTIRLQQPAIEIERAKDGRWNWEAIVKRPAAKPSGAAEPGELPRVKLRALLSDARVELRDDLLGTATTGSGISADLSADLTGSEPVYTFEANVPEVASNQSMGPLLAFLVPFASAGDSGAELSGKLRASGKGSVRGRTAAVLKSSLTADGRITLENGRISGSPLTTQVLSILDQPPVLELQSMEAPFVVKEGAVEITKAQIVSQRMQITFDGKTHLDGRLDLEAVARAIEPPGASSADARRGLGKLLESVAEVRFRIGGTIGAPSVTPEGIAIDTDDILEKAKNEALKRLDPKDLLKKKKD